MKHHNKNKKIDKSAVFAVWSVSVIYASHVAYGYPESIPPEIVRWVYYGNFFIMTLIWVILWARKRLQKGNKNDSS